MDHPVNEDNGSPSMSKAEDNLSNSEGPLLKKREISKDPNCARWEFLFCFSFKKLRLIFKQIQTK